MTAIRTIDDLYMASVQRINEESLMHKIGADLMNLSNNDDRVKMICEMLQKQKLLPSIIVKKKSEEASLSFRNLGNNLLRDNQVYEALQLYNLAILHSPTGSQSMALAIGNRSAVLCFMKNYNDSLKDIETVLNMDLKHSEDLLSKLLKRQKLCEDAISKQEFCEDRNSISEEYWKKMVKVEKSHGTIPCASSSIDVRSTKDIGRHVVACQDIKVGEVIAVEKPYSSLLLKSQYLIRCHRCLEICNNLIPCDHCCFIMFCSSTCKEAAWTEYHEIECPLMATLVQMDFTKLELLALRTVIKSRTQCSSWKLFTDIINDAESGLETDYRGYLKTNEGKHIYDSKYYNSIHTLATNVERRSMSDLYQKAVTAAVFLHYLSIGTKFLKIDEENMEKDSIILRTGGLLLLHIMTCPTNMHSLTPLVESEDGKFLEDVSIGSASYAFMSLINHSCSPNVTRTSYGTEMALIALRPIRKGMQLFDNYGFHHAMMSAAERRSGLLFQYKFTCSCEACEEKWPTYMQIKPARNPSRDQQKLLNSNILDETTIETLQLGDINFAVKKFPQLCEAAALLENKSPCLEVCNYQEALKQCLSLMSGTVPRGYNRLYKWY